ncbi:MAG: Thioredoxin [Candidatus Omnitrophica bacterium ADurb.Bin292]|jgi:thioredoxin 1|nr:MAG: Thioredoxin [Candidatus Omnitrophica bacterium ADurb.Bin292]HOG24206.1 thioredoxin [Candidatus Omnitrophota bacterium]HPW77556.1 thioredoxin [Candidatus Omnitrophota bacterium]HQB12671.1 thioredoxin [Candidatus Omnitrophota bacterium]
MSQEKVFTDANFQTEVLQSAQPVLVDFWAEWCGPCRMLGPVVEKIAAANAGKITVGKMNVDENPGTPSKYGIQGIPTIIFFKGGQPVQQLVGYQSQDKIQKMIDEILR